MTDAELNAELKQATERLAEQVATLSLALQTVNHLQRRQLDTDQRLAKVADESVTKTEFAQSVEDNTFRVGVARKDAQRRLRIFAISAACVSLLVSLGAVGFAYKVNRDRLNEQQSQRVALCRSTNAERSEAATREREYFAPKLVAEQHNPHADPVLASILQALAHSQPDLVACPTP